MKTSCLTAVRHHLIHEMRFILVASCKSDQEISKITGVTVRELGKVRSRNFSDGFPTGRLVEIAIALGMKVSISIKDRSDVL